MKELWSGTRPLVPSDREQAQGKEVAAPTAATLAGESSNAPRASGSSLLRGYLTALNPSTVTGGASTFPLVVIALLALVDGIEGGTGILYPDVIRAFHIHLSTLVAINSAIGIPLLFVSLGAGYVADRVHRVRLYFAGKVVQALAVVGIGLSPNAGYWALGQALGVSNFGGVGGQFANPAKDTLIADYYAAETRGRVYGFIQVAILSGSLVGPLVVGVMADRASWRLPYLVMGAFGVPTAAFALLLKNPPRGIQDRLAAGVSQEKALIEQQPPGFAEAWRASFAIRTLRRIWYAQVCQGLGGTMVGAVLLFHLAVTYHLPATQRAFIASAGVALGLVGIIVSAPLADVLFKRRPGWILTYMGLIQAAGMLFFILLSVVPNPFIGGAGVVVLTLFGAVQGPLQLFLMSLVIPARLRAFGTRANLPFQLLVLLLAPVLVLIAETLGFQLGILLGVPIYLAGALLLITGASAVDADIRAARAASLADEVISRARYEGAKPLLLMRDVDVHYDQVQILFNIDLDIDEGDTLALLGVNGAGKSTLLRALTGLTEASNGAIFFDGEDITHAPPHVVAERGIVIVSGGHGVFPGMTVEENLRAATWLSSAEADKGETKLTLVLDEFFPELRSRLHQKAGSLSGGEQQMLGLAQAFLMRARLLLIDELSLGLSPAVVRRLLEVVRRINAEGTTVILIEQSVDTALSLARRAVVLEKGGVVFDGLSENLRAHPELLQSLFLAGARGQAGLGGRRVAVHTGEGRPEPVLVLEGLSAGYGGVNALDGVDLQVGAGEIVGLIGPNGAGKTTLFDVATGFLPARSGRVLFSGRDVTALGPSTRARLGLTRSFQDARLFPSMTVRETLVTALDRHARYGNPLLSAVWAPSVRREEARLDRRADRLLETFNLKGFEERFVTELSTGVHRVLDLACVMATEPEILLLDEPSSGLSQSETEEMGPLLLRLRRESGVGILVIEHDMRLIATVSDHLVAMDLGRVIAEGRPQDVIQNPLVVRSYLGAAAETQSNQPLGGTTR